MWLLCCLRQARASQCFQSFQNVRAVARAAYHFCRLDRPATSEDRKAPKERLLLWRQQVVTPAIASRIVRCRGGRSRLPPVEQEAFLEPVQQRIRRQNSRPCRSQFDGER